VQFVVPSSGIMLIPNFNSSSSNSEPEVYRCYLMHIVQRLDHSDLKLFLILVITIVLLDLCIGNCVAFVNLNFSDSIPSHLKLGYFYTG
jgi:hypothetical protein